MVTATGPATGPQPDPGRQHGWRRALDREELHRYLTTLEGWREFAVREPAPPDLLPGHFLEGLDPDERLDYDDGRIDYHTRLTVAETSTLRTVVHTGRRLTLLNRHAISARRGLILSGPAYTGKTTALTQFGKTIEAIDRRRRPRSRQPDPGGLRHRPARRDLACWPWNSPASWACPSPPEPTSPTSSKPSAVSSSTQGSPSCVSTNYTLSPSRPATAPRSRTP